MQRITHTKQAYFLSYELYKNEANVNAELFQLESALQIQLFAFALILAGSYVATDQKPYLGCFLIAGGVTYYLLTQDKVDLILKDVRFFLQHKQCNLLILQRIKKLQHNLKKINQKSSSNLAQMQEWKDRINRLTNASQLPKDAISGEDRATCLETIAYLEKCRTLANEIGHTQISQTNQLRILLQDNEELISTLIEIKNDFQRLRKDIDSIQKQNALLDTLLHG